MERLSLLIDILIIIGVCSVRCSTLSFVIDVRGVVISVFLSNIVVEIAKNIENEKSILMLNLRSMFVFIVFKKDILVVFLRKIIKKEKKTKKTKNERKNRIKKINKKNSKNDQKREK